MGISIGVATLIIALSIISGLEKTINKKIIELDSHIKIFSIEHKKYMKMNDIEPLIKKHRSEFNYISPFLTSTVILTKKNQSEGIIIKGIKDLNYIEKLNSNLIEGSFNNTYNNELIIGKSLSKRIFLNVGDKVLLTSLSTFNQEDEVIPNIDLFTITGIYETGITQFDNQIVFSNLETVQELLVNGEDLINGVDLSLKKFDNIYKITSGLRESMKFPLYTQNIFEIHRNIFNWIELQKKPIPIVLSLIILVAVFNIISTLFLIEIERTSSIGILKALGLKRTQIISIFLMQGTYIGFIGILAGNILSLILMFIQNQLNLIKVPSNIYLVTKVPFDFSIIIFISVSIITLILALLASVIPSLITSRINPIKAIKFQ
jgi:lipoprotein-releasing system permease protein